MFLSLTVNSDLAISIFVCSFEEWFCLSISQISAILGKALQYEPEEKIVSQYYWTDNRAVWRLHTVNILCVSSSLELFLLYESATIHIQNLEDLLDVLSWHGPHSHHFKELFGVECFCYKRKKTTGTDWAIQQPWWLLSQQPVDIWRNSIAVGWFVFTYCQCEFKI